MTNMSDAPRDRERAKRKAQDHFAKAEQRDILVRQEQEKLRNATATKTAKLRALRLARDAANESAAEANPPVAKAPARKRRVAPAIKKAIPES